MAPAYSKSIGTSKMSCEECWITLAEDDCSAVRALVLAKSLRRVATTRKIAVVVCDEVSDGYRTKLQSAFDQCIKLCMPCERNGAPLQFYVKVFCWSMPFVRKCVFLGHNTMVLKNCDELFDYPGTAALFNKHDILETSVLVFEPSYDDYSDLCNWLRSGKLHNIHGTQLDVQFGKWIMKRKRFTQLSSKFNVEIDLKETCATWFSDDLGIVRFYGSHPNDFIEDNDTIENMTIVEKALVKYWKETYNQDVLPLLRDPPQTSHLDSQKTSCLAFPGIDQNVLDGNKEPIAIIGMSCRFPDSNNLEEYWSVLENGKDCIRKVPDHRWPSTTSEEFREVQAGFLKCPVDEFDGKFFNISPFELTHTDPQQRFLLEVSWEALEHAGINPQSLAGSNTGVFVGTWTQDYRDLIKNVNGEFSDFHRTYMGNSLGGTSGRLSFLLGLNGPNIASESGCSSSMVALYLAVDNLRKRRSDLALAAGANLLLHPFQKRHMVNVASPDGRCKTFDESADGFGRAEGVATLVLKRYSDALKAGDNVLALIRGCGISQEGTSRSFGTPTKEGQEIAMQAALEDANVRPEDVSYVEAHGTGTVVGDVTEMAAITSLYCKNDRDTTLLVASGKTNIGHTESCSGIAGIIKVILAMQHETIPPHINLCNLNPHINLDCVPVRIPQKLEKWERVQNRPRIAGISSFGITGTNSHVILQESPKYMVPSLALDIEERSAHIFTFSAKTESALNDVLESNLKYLEETPDCSLADIAFTCNAGRAHFQYRTFIVAASSQELCQKLVSSSRKAHHAPESRPEICFLFTGQGSQYVGMAKTLYRTSPVFRMNLDRCEKILQNRFKLSIIPAMWPEENNDLLQHSLYSQVSIFCLEYCLMKLYESWGVKPDSVIGHSLGEFSAAVCAEIISFEDAIKLVAERSRLIQEKAPRGQMIVVKADQEKVDAILGKFASEYPEHWLDYAAFNSVEQTVLAGSSESVKLFANFIQCMSSGPKTHVIEASSAFHSRDMDHILSEYRQILSDVKFSTPKVQYISGVTGQVLKQDEMNAEYWIKHTREPVRFLHASKVAQEHGYRLFLEVGPQPVLCALTMANSGGSSGEALTLLPSLRKSENEWDTLLTTLGKLYQLGFEINWHRYDQYYNRKKLHLPSYPFSRRKHWYETKENQQGIVFNTKSVHPLLGCHIPNATSNAIFQSSVELEKLAYLKDHSIGGHIVFPAAGFLEMSLSAGCLSTTGHLELVNPMSVENLTVEVPLEIVPHETCHIQIVVSKADNDDSKISIFTQKTLGSTTHEGGTSSVKWMRQSVASFVPLQINYHLRDEMESLQDIKSRCLLQNDTIEFYENLTAVGLEFGNNFKSLKKVWKNDNGKEILTEIQLESDQEVKGYLCHPVVLDALIQTIMVGIDRPSTDSLYVPLSIGKVVLFAKTTSQCYFAYSRWTESPDCRSATLYDKNGNIIAYMERVQLIQTKLESIVKHFTNKTLEIPNMYEEIWRPKIGPMKTRTDLKIMNGENLFSPEFSNELESCNSQTEEHVKMVANRKKLVYSYVLKAFYNLGWEPELGKELDVDSFMSQMNILPNLRKLIARFFEILHEEGILSRNPWQVISIPPPVAKVEEDISNCVHFIREHPNETGDAKVTIACGERLSSFIEGKESALSFLFPEDKTTEVSAETFYNESITVNAAHIAFTSTVKKLMENYTSVAEDQRGVIRILEVGAGTGSTTKRLLPIFDEFKAKFQYTYTDISSVFFIKARAMFETYGQKIQYKVFNAEENAFTQGFIPHHFDIVIASNVLHATKDLAESVRNVRSLLKEDGLLLMVETTDKIREYDIVFGLLDGFWRFDDYEIRPNYPCASGEIWEKVCRQEGYSHFNFFPCFGGQVGVLVARSSSPHLDILNNNNISVPSCGADVDGWWLVFADTKVFPSHLEHKFYQVRRKLITVKKSNEYNFNSDSYQYHVRSDIKSDFVNIFKMIEESKLKIEGIAYLWGLDKEEDPLKITTPFLFLAQILLSEFKGLPKFVLATEGIMPIADESAVNITPSTLWGMVRSFRTEHFNLHVRSVDLDPDEDDLQLKYSELFSEFWNDDQEFQIAYRQRSRHVCRLVQCKDFATPLSLPNSERYSLKLPDTKNIADLRFCPNGKAALKGNEVDVEVCATGLNFRDVFVVLKPEKQFDSINCLGLEFAGVVIGTGPAVTHMRVGDHVMGCKFADGALPSHVQMDEDLLFKIPKDFTFCEAATIPAAFATAYYCLVMVANLTKDERVLIHAGSGGVGLFAIQVAKAVGAKIIVTAGSRRKRAFLRNLGIEHVFHSRNTEYAKQIKEVTKGEGVHVILNSLTSPGFKEASLSVCCKNGRFVEMSKLHVWTPEEVQNLRPDVQYNIVDLTTVKKETWKSFWVAIDEYINQGHLHPIPYTRFEATHIREALYYMQKARHIGKIIVAQPIKMTLKECAFEPDFKIFNDSSTYLITGGLGGIGIELTKWLVKNGGKNIVLTSRRKPDENAEKVIKDLQDEGNNIVAMSVDVGEYDQCEKMLNDISDPKLKLPKLRGVFHLAGCLSDSTYVNQSIQSFETVFKGKVYGAWNLHLLTRGYNLEHFTLFSSMVSILGPIGLGNYAAANAYLDALCHYRIANGLTAQCINWGQFSEVGAAKHINMPAVKPFTPHQGLLALEAILNCQKTQIAVLDVDFQYVRKLTSNVGTYLEELQITKGNQGVAFTVKIGNFWDDFNICDTEEKKLGVIKFYVGTILRQILKFDDDEAIDENIRFSDLGMDSLMMLEMKNFLQTMLGKNITMNVSELAELTTINKLASHVLHLIEKSEDNGVNDTQPGSTIENKSYDHFSEELRKIIEEDMILPETITGQGDACTPSAIQTVLLTGVTGKLGPYMLEALLKRSIVKVYCLIRAKDEKAARERLNKSLREKDRSTLPLIKVEPLAGDITDALLGLDEATYNRLSETVDAVVHCAVKGNLMDPYIKSGEAINHTIRNVNVIGTRNVLEFAGKIKSKRVLHASTLLACHKVTEDDLLFEDWCDPMDVFDMKNVGYPVSKFISEILAHQAVDRRIPVEVHRFPLLLGDDTGRFSFPNNHAMLRLLGFCKLKAIPEIPVPLQVLPVDFAAEISCQIFFNEDAPPGVYNLTNPKMSILQDFPQLAKEYGFPIDIVEYSEFYNRLSEYEELAAVFPYREVDIEDGRFIDFTLSPKVMQCWSKDPENFFISNKIMKMLPNFKNDVLNPIDILRRDMEYAKNNGIFAKMKLS